MSFEGKTFAKGLTTSYASGALYTNLRGKDMNALFLGTCACDYSPKLKNEFADQFDFDARRSSAFLLDGRYLIDCGEHTLQSLRIAKIDYEDITDIFLTHLHSDHYNANNIAEIAKSKKDKLRVWVREDATLPNIENVEVVRMKLGEKYTVSPNCSVMGLLANHDEKARPQHFVFECEDKKILYACDGAWFLNETWYRLKGLALDMVVLDATCGDYLGDYRVGEHNTIPMIRLMLPSMKTWGTIVEGTKIYLSHLAPSLHKSHEETSQIVQADGLLVAYDGLQVEL